MMSSVSTSLHLAYLKNNVHLVKDIKNIISSTTVRLIEMAYYLRDDSEWNVLQSVTKIILNWTLNRIDVQSYITKFVIKISILQIFISKTDGLQNDMSTWFHKPKNVHESQFSINASRLSFHCFYRRKLKNYRSVSIYTEMERFLS